MYGRSLFIFTQQKLTASFVANVFQFFEPAMNGFDLSTYFLPGFQKLNIAHGIVEIIFKTAEC